MANEISTIRINDILARPFKVLAIVEPAASIASNSSFVV